MKTSLPKTQTFPPVDPFRSLFDSFFNPALPEAFTRTELSPRTNIAETEAAYVIATEMPGVEEQDVHVELHDAELTIRAERKEEAEEKGRTWHRIEHAYGQMTRTIRLPKEVDRNAIEAVLRKGILTVTVPKAAATRPARVAVRSE